MFGKLIPCTTKVKYIIWREGCTLPFPKKGDLDIPSNYRGITLTLIPRVGVKSKNLDAVMLFVA